MNLTTAICDDIYDKASSAKIRIQDKGIAKDDGYGYYGQQIDVLKCIMSLVSTVKKYDNADNDNKNFAAMKQEVLAINAQLRRDFIETV